MSKIIQNDQNNAEIEKGSAINDGIIWLYVVQKSNPNLHGCRIIAYAYDLPGNEGIKEVEIT